MFSPECFVGYAVQFGYSLVKSFYIRNFRQYCNNFSTQNQQKKRFLQKSFLYIDFFFFDAAILIRLTWKTVLIFGAGAGKAFGVPPRRGL